MVASEKLFGNFFNDKQIINPRLFGFGQDTLNRLTAANGGGDYTTLINLLTPPLTAFGAEIGEVDIALGLQKGKTLTTDQVIAGFKLTMSEKEGVIAAAVGGFNSAAFLEFYPHGLVEYSKATKTQMPTLTQRVRAAATAHAVALGAPLTAQLQGFQLQWTSARDQQETQKGVVSDNRTERTDARIALELVLLTVIHTIAAKFPGAVEQCNSFFAFNMLFPQGHLAHQTTAGIIPENGKVAVMNRTFTDADKLNIKNPDENAPFQVYLGATADAEPGPLAKTVQPQHGIRPKPSALGDLNNTFLIIKNLSAVNEGSFFVDIAG